MTSSVFRFTVEKGYLAINPMAGMKAPDKLKKRKRVLTDEELVAVWKAAEQTEGHFGCACRKSNSHIQMVKSAEECRVHNAANGMNSTR
jgi:integrase